MLKSIFLTLNLSGLLFVSLFNIENLEITHEGPSEIQSGNFTEITISINKGNFSGPARLKLNFENAEGLTPSEISNAGSSYTFSNNEALFIWYSIPSDDVITLKYRLNASETSIGKKKITGTFSYLDENEKQQVEIPSLFIEVLNHTVSNNNENINLEEKEYHGPIECSRTITPLNDYFIVSIHTIKSNERGFARIKDILPDGFKAESIETAGAVFKNIDGSAKFLWSELPSSLESFTVSYKLIPNDSIIEDFSVQGTFSAEFLISGDQTNKIIIPTSTYSANELANEETTNEETTNEEITNEETTIEETTIEETTNEETTNEETTNEEITNEETTNEETTNEETTNEETTNEETTNEETTNEETTNEETSTELKLENNTLNQNLTIRYKVQILAAHKTASNKYFNYYHNYSAAFDIENHEGWIKYTTGDFQQYKEARNKREKLKKYKFPGPFVTAYNNSERITVQEALMISKQDWVQ